MEIKPLSRFNKTLTTAPDKSITHRAIMFNALASGNATVTNALLGEDCLATIDCMRSLGATITVEGDVVRITGTDKLNSAHLYVGNSGTTFRLLSGVLASRDGTFTLDGDSSIRKRPMNRVITPLSLMGGAFTSTNNGYAPVTVSGGKLSGITYRMPVDSAQVKSAILLAGLNADGETTVIENNPSRNHTEIMLKSMGADITQSGNVVTVKKSKLNPVNITVPGDISSAAYPLVLAACLSGAIVTVKRVGINPTRDGIITVMQAAGVDISLDNIHGDGERVADITVKGGRALSPVTVGGELIPLLIDEIPVIAVMCCFINGTSVIKDASELKVKESNRIDSVVNALKTLGADVTATDDGMIIRGKGYLVGGGTIDSLGDHRIAMAMSVAGALSRGGATILNHECVDVSYPHFYDIFKD